MITSMDAIDLNADVGELGAQIDAAILPAVSSVNIACGGHAGDAASMRQVSRRAAELGLRVGAHPSYIDPEGFGRRRLDVRPDVLGTQIRDQILTLADHSPTPPEYVKPHGALYHAAARDPELADVLLQAVVQAAEQLAVAPAVMGQPGAAYLTRASAVGVATINEAFADRAYTADGQLVPRGEDGAVLHDDDAVLRQVAGLARGEVLTVDGTTIAVRATSVCIHSDTPRAVELAHRIRAHLDAHGIAVRA